MKVLRCVLVLIFFHLGVGYAVTACSAAKPAVEAYLQLLEEYPGALGPLGDWQDGEIEIVTDVEKIAEIEVAMGRTVGIIARDRYWIWVNDAVHFPSGKYGVYGRMLWTQSLQGRAGVAVMCVYPDGRIALNCNYRHATRAWELELPRGALAEGESPYQTAKREVLEETGMVVDEVVLLGEIATDSGMTSTVVPIFLATVVGHQAAAPEDSEAIEGVVALSQAEVLEGLRQGELTVTVNGRKRVAKLRDPFLTYALLQAQIQGVFK